MLILPENSKLQVTVGDVHEYACKTLESPFPIIPEAKKRKLVNHLVEYCASRARGDKELSRAILVLRKVAVEWNDVPLLLRAAKACSADVRINIMRVDGFISAYQAGAFYI